MATAVNEFDAAMAERDRLYEDRYSNPDVWGTEGAYYGGKANIGSGESSMDVEGFGDLYADIDGKRYMRTGTADNTRFDDFGGGYFRDDRYGWVVDPSVAEAYAKVGERESRMYFASALASVLGGPYAASVGLTGAGAGTMGAEGGVFDQAGNLIPTQGPDLVQAAQQLFGGNPSAMGDVPLWNTGGETGAFDMGQFSPSDVGLDFGGSYGSGTGIPSAYDYGFDGANLTEAIGSSGIETPATSMGSTMPPAMEPSTAWGGGATMGGGITQTGSTWDKILEQAWKHAPGLAMGVYKLLAGDKGNDYADRIGALGQTQADIGRKLLEDYQKGVPVDKQAIDNWERASIAQMRQFYANAKIPNSSQAKLAEQEIRARANGLRQTSLNGTLKTGLEALGVADKYQLAAIEAEMKHDAAAQQQFGQFMSVYAQWLLRVPDITGQKKTPVLT